MHNHVITGDKPAWKHAIEKNEHNLIESIQNVADAITSKLRYDISDEKYKQIVTTLGSYSKTSQLIHAICACNEEFIFNKFCDILVELDHADWANRLRQS